MTTIGYAGMSHLGLVSAVAAAERGFRTVAYDADAALVARLGRGELPVTEPDLDAMTARNAARLTFTARLGDLKACDVVYVARDVPTDDRGQSDLGPIDALIRDVRPHLKKGAALVVLSQVTPGFTRARMAAGLVLYYQVETLIFGRAVERATKPERSIVGCADPAQPLHKGLAEFLGAFGCPILPMRYESAELAKTAINLCLVASIGVANTLADLSERIGADWSEIVPSLRLDRRIGPYSYIVPGLGIAGGNLERDLATIIGLCDRSGADAGILRAQIANNRRRADWALQVLARRLAPGPAVKLAVLGLAYKENTHSTKNSPSLALLKAIPNLAVRAYDPVVAPTAAMHPNATRCFSALQACEEADAVAVMTPWPEFRRINPVLLGATLKGRLAIDPFAVLDRRQMARYGFEHHVLGAPSVA
ncbi:MAG: UDP-glucose/GDP-mannose dehydrogenase family protein [Alphaproteobacteria bacterium]|nr:UDP-glucose/GDP-mannose dehydrogenase family protein [Alphaproteobacteria bacterium]